MSNKLNKRITYAIQNHIDLLMENYHLELESLPNNNEYHVLQCNLEYEAKEKIKVLKKLRDDIIS